MGPQCHGITKRAIYIALLYTQVPYHEFLVYVEVSPDVDGDFLVEETSNLEGLVHPGDLASIPSSQTKVFEVVNTLGRLGQ